MSAVSPSAQEWQGETFSLFFYGTLIHPGVLKRVIGHEGQNLHYQPAVLFDFTRHHVNAEDYPAILPWDQARLLFSDPNGGQSTLEPPPSERNVRGSLVSGLSKVDVELLDIFEGDEYKRDLVTVIPLKDQQPFSVAADDDGIVFDPVTYPAKEELPKLGIKAHTYAWNKPPLETLEPKIWSYQTFIKDNVHRWVGGEVNRFSYLDVDNRREAIEQITAEQSLPPELPMTGDKLAVLTNLPGTAEQEEYVFGHGMRKYFCFNEGYRNLNHGSYGSIPRPVMEAAYQISMKIEGNTDMFHRVDMIEGLTNVRTRLAKFINASDVDELVLVPNTMHGVNTVLHNIRWKPDDILIGFTTTYGAVSNTAKRFADTFEGLILQTITLHFPTDPESIVSLFRNHIQGLQRKPGSTVVAIIDGIISVPGVRIPWEEMVKICRENEVYSLVDGAHVIGQIPLDVQQADPDFFISNCHKWLYVKRPCALLYVPKRNQQMIRWTFPISIGYVSPPGEVKFAEQFDWTGTIDYAPFLSVNAALDFREKIGGEEKIQDYCHRLAREGGKRMAEILGTELLDEQDQFTASMVDVRLPLPKAELLRHPTTLGLAIHEKLLKEHNCMSAIYMHNDKLWTRASAQIWLEVSDFEYVAKALAKICQDFIASQELVRTDIRDGTIIPPPRQ